MQIYSLLLSSTYEAIKFLPERRVIRLIMNGKAEVIANWDFDITWVSGRMKHPSIIKLINNYRMEYKKKIFSRSAIIKRDNKTCQYCGFKLSMNRITIDHVIPISKGGKGTFENCVVACRPCNDYKADYDLDKCGLKILREPKNPGYSPIYTLPLSSKLWHKEWNSFI